MGCNCPVEVFNIINLQENVIIDSNIIIKYNINIGNRFIDLYY